MGMYTEELKHIIHRNMGKGMTRDQAFTLLRSSIGNAPHRYELEIAEIIDMAVLTLAAQEGLKRLSKHANPDPRRKR